MANFRAVSQKGFFKGLHATESLLAQVPGIVSRISNLIFTKRGALNTCDGTKLISQFNGALQNNLGPITELKLFNPANVTPFYVALYKDPTTHLGNVAGMAVVDGGAGGTLAAATYFYKVTANDGAGGTTLLSAATEVSIVNPGGRKNTVSWTALANANSYTIWRGTSAGNENYQKFGITGTSFIDDGSIVPNGSIVGPGTDTTQVCQLVSINASTYGAGNILATFPADPIAPSQSGDTPKGTSGGSGGSSPGSFGGGGSAQTSTGGNTGNLSPLPQFVMFTDKMILALGNGFAPQTYDGTTVAAVTNTFTTSYPDWVASTASVSQNYNKGDVIKPTVNNAGGFVFTAKQAGKAGLAAPTFPQTKDQVVGDGSVIWKNTGTTSTAPAPRGAAHAIVHAGALWLANTNPTTTADLLDGPSVLKMSDVNNPASWNPINVAFIGKDDGTQIMGLATFSIAEVGIPPTAALVVFKEFSTYVVNSVFGADNFSIQQAQTDLGCIAPRSIQFVPGFGIIRLTHLGLAVFDGVRDRLITEEIRPYIFDDVTDDITAMDWSYAYFSKGTQTAVPPMYCLAIPLLGSAGALTRILCYDLVLKCWGIVDLPFSIGTFTQIRTSGSIPMTLMGGFVDGAVRGWQQGFTTWDSNGSATPVAWSFRTAEVFGAAASDRTYFKRLFIRGTVPTGATATLNCTVNLAGQDQTAVTAKTFMLSSGQFECEVPIGRTSLNAHATISGTGVVSIDSVDWHVMPKGSAPVRTK